MLIPHWPIYTGPNKDFVGTVERTKYILSKLNNPHLKMRNIIHITGTKGKGSTSLYISNILRSCGYKVNTYLSPHIYECNERVLLNGEKITDEEIYNNIEMIRIICEENCDNKDIIEPAMFEVMTCCAFMSMSNNNADFNVIEVGCGARFDATNVFDENIPVACVFTPIHLDHVKILGNSITEVAINKSFLIKNGVKNVILSSQSQEAKDVIKNIAQKNNVNNIYTYGDDYDVFKGDNGEVFYESDVFDSYFPFNKPNMEGDYQLINCGCAITTCLSLQKENIISNLTLESVNEGIKNTFNIVRMQKIEKGRLFNELPKGSIFYVDGAHNQLAAHSLANFIKSFKEKNYANYKIVLAIARTKCADNEAFLKELFENNKPIVDLVICTRANLESVPEPPEVIADACKNLHFNYQIAYNIDEVLRETKNFVKQQKTLLICTGSLYIARDIELNNIKSSC